LAFQLADDLLDAGGDAAGVSFVALLGERATRERAEGLVREAAEAARRLPRPERLLELARFAVERSH
jgi:geranylgeranyl pyrophosphate synthase